MSTLLALFMLLAAQAAPEGSCAKLSQSSVLCRYDGEIKIYRYSPKKKKKPYNTWEEWQREYKDGHWEFKV